uniref:Uncharacterized protein n=1 Tax=Arundo donax TaxID=35708 RepID=A0A0A9F894_ARUDO
MSSAAASPFSTAVNLNHPCSCTVGSDCYSEHFYMTFYHPR